MGLRGVKALRVILLAATLLVSELVWSQTALALDPKKAITQYIHDVWRMEDGLPSNNVSAILQTRDGYLWLGTEGGLARFDGVKMAVFTPENTEALKTPLMRTLYEDRAGNLWIGTEGGGLTRYKEGRFTTYTTKDGLVDDRVRSISEDQAGNLWIGTPVGLNRFKDGSFTTPIAKGKYVYADQAGNLWIWWGGVGEILCYSDGKLTTHTLEGDLPNRQIASVCEDRAGNLWIGTYGGLNRFKEGKFTRYTTKEGWPGSPIHSICEDRDGNLWIGTYGAGLTRFKDGKFTTLTANDGLSDNRVVAIHEDREGNLWVGTQGGGLNRFKDGNLTTYTMKEGLPHDWALSVYEDRAGNLWIGTRGGLARMQTANSRGRKEGAASPTITSFTTKNGLGHDVVRTVYEDQAGTFWIGTQGGGLSRFKGGRFTTYAIKAGLSQNDVRAIYEDRQGRLWIGGSLGRSGLVQLKDGKFIFGEFTSETGAVRSILEGREGSLWFGTSHGLLRFKENQSIRYTTKEGLSGLNVFSLCEDREGVLWIGTYGGGLTRFKDGRFTGITAKEGLFDNVVYKILEDARGNLWMSGNKGIFRVSKREMNDFAEGKIRSITCVAYGAADGMKSAECNGGNQSAGCRTRDGKLWFPTTMGVVMIDPKHISTNTVPPPVYVEQVLIDKTSVDAQQKAEVPPGKGDLEFHYTALSFLDPSKVKFRYRLEGYDEDWIDAGTRRVAYYTSISPGDYRFRVMACNNDGAWNEAGAAVEFYLKPHFYQTHWFYALCALALVLMGVGVSRLRIRQLKARELKLNQLVQERTRELVEVTRQLVDMNDTLEQRVQDGIKALAEAERMAAYGQMVAGVAHEVRHPIFGLQTAAYLLKQNLEDRNYTLSQLEIIERETKRMRDLMQDLLDFAKPKALTLTPTNTRHLLEEVVKTYRTEHDPKFPPIVLDLDGTLPHIMVDQSRLVQVMVNLIENAAKHAKGLTTVTISIDGTSESQVCVRVKDDGAGIAPAHLPHIFDPFFTTGKGTGLGLALVQRIVKEHGGTIRVQSELGKGTTFTICLPTESPTGEIRNPNIEIRNNTEIRNPNDQNLP